MTVKKMYATEIFNAQGLPTLQCTIILANNQTITSSIPSGFPQQSLAASYLYDKDERLLHYGMLQAVDYINNTIAPLFINQPINALAMDSQLMDLDTSLHKSEIGANTTLVVSYALFKAQASSENISLYQLLQSLSGTKEITLPTPIISVIETDNAIHELLLIPQQDTFHHNIDAAAAFYHHAQKILTTKNISTAVGKYGSFVLDNNLTDMLSLTEEILKTLPQYTYQVGITINHTNIYDHATKTYHWNNKNILSTDLINAYETICDNHSFITYIQDGMGQQDLLGWQDLTQRLNHISIAADTIFSSNSMHIRKGILHNIGNHTIIRPEYIGTISQTIAAIDACKKNNRSFIIASDQGQTCDSFCIDLAIGTGASHIKAGGITRAEFTSKYNRAIEIEKSILS